MHAEVPCRLNGHLQNVSMPFCAQFWAYKFLHKSTYVGGKEGGTISHLHHSFLPHRSYAAVPATAGTRLATLLGEFPGNTCICCQIRCQE